MQSELRQSPRLAYAAFFFVLACTADAPNSAADQCNALAGHPFEPGNREFGIEWDSLDAELAIPACREAVRQDASMANQFRLARALHKAKNYDEAMVLYRKAADRGYAMAQNGIGVLYNNGFGVTQDYAKALEWYRRAAAQGAAPAQGNIGALYANGHGVTQDYAEGARWIRKAAEQGFAQAQSTLAYLYVNAMGVPEDYVEAAGWHRKAAEQGVAGA